MRRIYCVQPYRTKGHRLVASGATVYDDFDAAIAAGGELARRRTGVVVLAQDIDARSGLLAKPLVLAIHGRVPSSWHGPGGIPVAA